MSSKTPPIATGLPSQSYKWVSKNRNYSDEKKKGNLAISPVLSNQHPLKFLVDNIALPTNEKKRSSISSSSNKNIKDPLSDPLSSATLDPLSKMVADLSFKEKVNF